MKKTAIRIIALACVMALAAAVCFSTSAIEIKRLYGDVDNDGYVTTYDALLILRAAIGVDVLDGYDEIAADMDSDGEISLADVRLALKTAAQVIAPAYIEELEFSACPEQFINELNAVRSKNNAARLSYSKALSSLAEKAAKEFAEQTGTALRRADGSYYFKILDEAGFEYNSADKVILANGPEYSDALDEMLKDSQSEKALCGKAFSKAGVGAYSPDGRTFYWCVLLIDEV